MSNINEKTNQLIERNRKHVLTMLSGKNSRSELLDLSTIESDIDTKLFKQDYVDTEVVVYDGDINLNSGVKKTKSDLLSESNEMRLMSLSSQPEISDVLDIIIDELYSYKHGTLEFAELSTEALSKIKLDKALFAKIETKLNDSFSKVYSLHKFDLQTISNDYDIFKILKLFLVLGKCRFYVEYDNIIKPTAVKSIHYLDPRLYRLEKYQKRMKSATTDVIFYKIQKSMYRTNHETMWNISSVDHNLPTIVLESQIIDIDWLDLDIASNVSYVAGLERAFNVYRLMERTRITWAYMNATWRSVNIIPTKGQGRAKSLQTLRSAIQKYGEKITFNDSVGTVSVNGETQQRFNKELWLAETSSGTPTFDTVGNDGPEIQDMGPVAFFLQRFNKATKVPPSMLDREQQNYWSNDETQISLEYNRFGKWLNRIRRSVSPIMTKPVWSEFYLDEQFAEYKSDLQIQRSIQLKWNTRDVFAKQLELSLLEKNIGVIDSLSNIGMTEDSKIPILSKRILIKRYLDMTEDELKAHREQVLLDLQADIDAAKDLGLDEDGY